MKNIKALLLLIGLFIFSSCQPYEKIDESLEIEEVEEVEEEQPKGEKNTNEDWKEDNDTTTIVLYPTN